MSLTYNQTIAQSLAACYKRKAELTTQKDEADYQLLQVKARTIPADAKIAGSNVDERKFNEARLLVDNEAYQKAAATCREVDGKIEMVKAEIDGLESQRRASEWDIRERLVATISPLPQAEMDRNQGIENTAFDNATQSALDSRAIAGNGGKPGPIRFTPNPAQPKPAPRVYNPPPPPDDLPF